MSEYVAVITRGERILETIEVEHVHYSFERFVSLAEKVAIDRNGIAQCYRNVCEALAEFGERIV